MIKLLTTKIEDLLTKEETSKTTKEIIDIFLKSINDWPNEVDSLDDYDLEIQNFISDQPNKRNIKKILRNIDIASHMWEVESLTQLLNIYKYYDSNMSLKSIISNLKEQTFS